MGFKEVQDLDCDTTTALGGINKKNGKANPTKVEGYYIGSKETPSRKAKNGIAMLHILQTKNGRLGVWGKTDLDRKLVGITPGVMTRITQSGTVPTPNGDMYKFKVEFDAENAIEVNLPTVSKTASSEDTAEDIGTYSAEDSEETEESDLDSDGEEPMDEVQPVRATPPRRVAAPADPARKQQVQDLLNRRTKAAS